MQFVRTDELRPGMRLAKPIYNKNGVLLYERNSRLTIPAINSVRNFNLIGIYVLEPAEPAPPFSKEDIEFEQAQTVYTFKLRDIYDQIYKRIGMEKLPGLIDDILKRYGNLHHRVNFNQNLRSADDFMYKHAISTAVLATMISQYIEMTENDRNALIIAAFIYGFGYRFVPKTILSKDKDLTQGDIEVIQAALEKGISYLRMNPSHYEFLPRALSVVEHHILSTNPTRKIENPSGNILLLSEILKVAKNFDLHTGMMMGHHPQSEIMAMNYLRENPSEYNATIVSILAQCIHIVPAGASVDLSTKDKAIVLVENPKDYLQPVILRFYDNKVYDLSDPSISNRIQIVDIMKTMDNRVEIDEHTLSQFVADKRIIETANRFRRKKKK